MSFLVPVPEKVSEVVINTMGSSSTRVRTCIAYRRRHPDTQLLRIVIDPARTTSVDDDGHHTSVVVADPARIMPGRGAWLTPSLEALDIAVKRGAIGRALKTGGRLDVSDVADYLSRLHD